MSARRGRRAKDGDTLVVLGSCRSGKPVSRTPVHHPALSQSLARHEAGVDPLAAGGESTLSCGSRLRWSST
jgi:hypothetical protein